MISKTQHEIPQKDGAERSPLGPRPSVAGESSETGKPPGRTWQMRR